MLALDLRMPHACSINICCMILEKKVEEDGGDKMDDRRCTMAYKLN